MRGDTIGLALALGLVGEALMQFAAPAAVADTLPSMRFVSDPGIFGSTQAGTPPAAGATIEVKSVVAPERPSATTAAPARKSLNWPVTLEEVKAREAAERSAKADVWPDAEIKAARLRCKAILRQINAVAVEEAPIRTGACGTPAPIRLMSFGRKPEVVISPPALINCEMAGALHTWVTRDLQPLARKHLGGPIIKIEKMSDYSCRNAYGRAKGRLSEHGRANALDIAGFTTSKGEPTMLLADWGMTARDIRRQVAAAKARALANDNKRMAAEIEGQRRATDTHGGSARAVNVSTPPAALGHASGAPGGGIARASVIDGVPSVTFSVAGGNDETAPPPPAFQNFISRLGGAVPRIDREAPRSIVALAASKSANVAVTEAGKSRFLRAAHVSACKIFGTVLGPEANNAHRNHFHIDLAQRRSGAFCQ